MRLSRVQAQDTLIKDIDGDSIQDTICLERMLSVITCQLSTQNFIETSSLAIEILQDESGLRETEEGFEFYNDWMRAGYINQFIYNNVESKVQLVKIEKYSFGNAMNDGAKNASVNLLTSEFIGNWSIYNDTNDEMVSLPTIKKKMRMPKIFLEDFSDTDYFDFDERCSKVFKRLKRKETL